MEAVDETIQRFLAEKKAQDRVDRADPILDALEDEVARLQEKLRSAQRRLTEHQVAAAEFQVGDAVEVQAYGRDRWRWRPAIVRVVKPRSWAPKPEYHVALLTKAGVPGRVTRSIADIRRPPNHDHHRGTACTDRCPAYTGPGSVAP